MKEIKEKTEKYCISTSGCGTCVALEMINKTEQDYTFIRVPKKVKLSEIIERLKTHYAKVEIRYMNDNVAIDCCLPEPHNTSLLSFMVNYNNNQIPSINADRWSLISNKKWLYEYWIAGTEIINDLEEKQ